MTVEDALMLSEGVAVVATRPDGLIVEGNVVEIQPYGHPEIDPSWTEDCTIIIKDEESGDVSHWRPSYVEQA